MAFFKMIYLFLYVGRHGGQRTTCWISCLLHHRHSKDQLGSPGLVTGFFTHQAILWASCISLPFKQEICFMRMSVLLACMSVHRVHVWCPQRTGEGIGCPEIGVAGYEPPCRCCESDPGSILWKSEQPLRHLPSALVGHCVCPRLFQNSCLGLLNAGMISMCHHSWLYVFCLWNLDSVLVN